MHCLRCFVLCINGAKLIVEGLLPAPVPNLAEFPTALPTLRPTAIYDPAEGTVTVSWGETLDASVLGKTISHFHLEWSDGGGWESTPTSAGLKSLRCVKRNLATGLQYRFRIKACSHEQGRDGQFGPPSAPVTIGGAPAQPPPQPQPPPRSAGSSPPPTHPYGFAPAAPPPPTTATPGGSQRTRVPPPRVQCVSVPLLGVLVEWEPLEWARRWTLQWSVVEDLVRDDAEDLLLPPNAPDAMVWCSTDASSCLQGTRCIKAGLPPKQRVVFRVRPLGRGVQGEFSQPSDSVWTSVPEFDDGGGGAEPVLLCSAAEMQAMLGKAHAEAGRLRDEMEAHRRCADELRAKHDAAVNDAVRLSDQLRAERVVTTELHGTVAELRMELKQAPRRRGRGVDDELLDLT